MFLYYIYILFTPFFYFIYIASIFNSKVRSNLFLYKQTLNDVYKKLNKNSKTVILFHAASAGEFEQLKPILMRIDRKKFFIVQSFTSSTIYNSNAYQKYVDVACYQPFDFLFGTSNFFFKTIQPHYYIVTRHDIWPKHIFIANKLGIKIFYINANLHKNSIWLQPYMKNLSKLIFNKISLITVPSKKIKNNITYLADKSKIQILIDTRFQQIYDRFLINKDKDFLSNKILATNNIIFGSIDRSDENIIFDALRRRYPNGMIDLEKNNENLIIVPHEVNDNVIKRLTSKLEKQNFKYNLYTDKSLSNNVVIINHVGILADLYKYAKLAYVGGGFNRGVHSVIEPAMYNCIISFGPNIEMLDEAQQLYENKIGYLIKNTDSMLHFFDKLNKYNEHVSSKKFILQHKNSIQTLLNYIK